MGPLREGGPRDSLSSDHGKRGSAYPYLFKAIWQGYQIGKNFNLRRTMLFLSV